MDALRSRSQSRSRRSRAVARNVGRLVGTVAVTFGAWLGYSHWLIDHNVELPPAFDARQETITSDVAGRISYYVDDAVPGRPLLLVHSVNAAASAYEMRPLFEHYRSQRPVYALDLPGFGFSERGQRPYSVELYTAALRDVLREIGTADVIALSLSSEFAARVAHENPDLVRSLALISPSGMGQRSADNRVQETGRTGGSERVLRFLTVPLWSQGLYDLLVSRPSLRYFLQLIFVGSVDEGWLRYSYATSHQPGARFAPYAFVSGKLFSPDIRVTVYEQLRQPALVLYDRDPNVSFDALPTLLERPNWHGAQIMPSLGVPHFEQREQTTAALDRFWSEQVD